MPNPEARVDVAVVGAGPAGVAAAHALIRAGLSVRVLDPGRPVAARIETLPPAGLALGDALGLGAALRAASAGTAVSMRLLWREAPELREFGADAPVLLDRIACHQALRATLPQGCLVADRCHRITPGEDGVMLQLGSGGMKAAFVLDARGRSGLRGRRPDGAALVALPFQGTGDRHAQAATTHLESLPDGWLWAACLPGGGISGSLFMQGCDLAGLDATGRLSLLARRLQGGGLGPVCGLAATRAVPSMLHWVKDPFAAPRVLAVGDAALARDPVASHGLVHALRSGVQAAAALATLCDPAGQQDAARAFVRDRHTTAVAAAKAATAGSHAGQARHRTAFWAAAAAGADVAGPEVERASPAWPGLMRPLALVPLQRAAVLQADRIGWAPALWLAHSGRAATQLGPVGAAQLVAALGAPAPLAVLATRLERGLSATLGPAEAARVAPALLRELLDEGALRDAAPLHPDQAVCARSSRA